MGKETLIHSHTQYYGNIKLMLYKLRGDYHTRTSWVLDALMKCGFTDHLAHLRKKTLFNKAANITA